MSEVQGTFLPGHFRRLYEYRAAQARGETPVLTPVERQNMANLQGQYDRWYREETAMRARRSTEPLHPRKALEYLSECYMDSDSSVYGIDEIMVFGGKVWFRWRDGTEHVFRIVLEEDRTASMSEQVTVTFTADVNAVTDALLAIEEWDERMSRRWHGEESHNVLYGISAHNALGPIVLAMRAARDEAIASD